MAIPPESLKPDRCYLTESGSIWKVTSTGSDGTVRYTDQPALEPRDSPRRPLALPLTVSTPSRTATAAHSPTAYARGAQSGVIGTPPGRRGP